MAPEKKEHKMLFDLRGGHRRNVVKVVYAVLAILMGASLFLTVGGFNIAEVFDGEGGSGDAVEIYEDQAERIEAKLKKDPDNPNLLLALTRADINAGNAGVTVEENGEEIFSTEAIRSYQQADQTWSEYLKAVKEPNPGLAQLVAPMQLQLAEVSRTFPEAELRIQAAADTQKIVAEQRPNLNSLSTLAFYTYFTGDFKAAEKARAEALKLATSESEREAIEKQLDEYKKNAKNFLGRVKAAEKSEKAGGQAPEGGNPLGGGGLTGGGLGE